MKKLGADGIYAAFSDDSIGSKNLRDHATRFEAYPLFWGSTLIVVEGGFDPIGTDMLPALKQMVGRLTHNRWAIMQPGYSWDYHKPSDTGRSTLDATVKALRDFCGPSHFIETKAAMQAAGNGSANDLADIANGVWPRSLMGDSIHPNSAGNEVLAGLIKAHVVTQGWA